MNIHLRKPRLEHLNFTDHCQLKQKKHQQETHKPTKPSNPKHQCSTLLLISTQNFWESLSQEKKREQIEKKRREREMQKRETTIFCGNTILVPTFWPYSHFSPYILILPHLVPKIKKWYRFDPCIFLIPFSLLSLVVY